MGKSLAGSKMYNLTYFKVVNSKLHLTMSVLPRFVVAENHVEPNPFLTCKKKRFKQGLEVRS